MKLEITVNTQAAIVTNAESVRDSYCAELAKYENCIATAETLKDDKAACARINALKKAVAAERIAFDRAVSAQEDIRRVHCALKAIEDACDRVRAPYWESVKAVEAANKPAETRHIVTIEVDGATAREYEKIIATISKMGLSATVKAIVAK